MRKRQYKTDPSILLEQGKDIVSQSADNKFVHRVSMVNLILGGMTPEELSLYCGDSRRVLYDWLTKVDEQGWDSLKAIKQQGRVPKLSETQIVEIKAAVEDDPEKYGYHVWDGPTLSAYIKDKYNVDLGVRACQKLLHKMGFSLIRPQTYPSLENPDDEAREEFKKKLKSVAEDPNIVPVFQDEVHFQVQTSITRKWALKGSEPKVMSKPGKTNVSYSGYVIPETGELVMTEPSWFNYETVIQSFRDFINARPLREHKKYCIILDNAPWHKKAIRLIWDEEQPEYEDIRKTLEYLSLPPYSPDLNPIEQVWRIARREKTHNRYFSSKSTLKETMDNYFDGFSKPNEQLKSLCSFKCFSADIVAA